LLCIGAIPHKKANTCQRDTQATRMSKMTKKEQQIAKTAESLLHELIDMNEKIPLFVWVSVCQAFVAKTYKANQIAFELYEESMKDFIEHYRSKWE